jgi:hypothetical protein
VFDPGGNDPGEEPEYLLGAGIAGHVYIRIGIAAEKVIPQASPYDKGFASIMRQSARYILHRPWAAVWNYVHPEILFMSPALKLGMSLFGENPDP